MAARRPIGNSARSYGWCVQDARYLAGPAEIAGVLGVEANTINVWRRRGFKGHAFPAPVVQLAGSNVWDVRDVIAWADRTGREVRNRTYTAPGWSDADS